MWVCPINSQEASSTTVGLWKYNMHICICTFSTQLILILILMNKIIKNTLMLIGPAAPVITALLNLTYAYTYNLITLYCFYDCQILAWTRQKGHSHICKGSVFCAQLRNLMYSDYAWTFGWCRIWIFSLRPFYISSE